MAHWIRSAARLLRISSSAGGCNRGWREFSTRAKSNVDALDKAASFLHPKVQLASSRLLDFSVIRELVDARSQPVGLDLSKRGFATHVPGHLQQPVKLKLYVGSPGVIAEPYTRPSSLPLFQRWLTKAGWQDRKARIVSVLKTAYTIARVRQKTKGYTQKKFYREVTDLYKEINSALAAGDRGVLRHLVTESVLTVMKKELKHRENSAWARVVWDLAGPIKSIGTVHGRILGFDTKNADNAFVQLTLRILSNHKFAAYDKQGKLVAGDPDKEIPVEEFWVFERLLTGPDVKWRLCGRLSI